MLAILSALRVAADKAILSLSTYPSKPTILAEPLLTPNLLKIRRRQRNALIKRRELLLVAAYIDQQSKTALWSPPYSILLKTKAMMKQAQSRDTSGEVSQLTTITYTEPTTTPLAHTTSQLYSRAYANVPYYRYLKDSDSGLHSESSYY